MRLFFFILIFSQLINSLVVIAEKKKDSNELNSIRWEKVKENKSNNLNKIIWKSYKDDESYVKSIEEREYLFDLDAGAKGLLAQHGRSDQLDLIFKSYSNLLRLLGN